MHIGGCEQHRIFQLHILIIDMKLQSSLAEELLDKFNYIYTSTLT